MQIHVSVRTRGLHSEPRSSVCGWDSLPSRQAACLWRHSSLSERKMSGRDQTLTTSYFSLTPGLTHGLLVSHQLFGCDGVLRSGAVRDMCGVCGGDGSSCSLTSDLYSGGQAKGSNRLSDSRFDYR